MQAVPLPQRQTLPNSPLIESHWTRPFRIYHPALPRATLHKQATRMNTREGQAQALTAHSPRLGISLEAEEASCPRSNESEEDLPHGYVATAQPAPLPVLFDTRWRCWGVGHTAGMALSSDRSPLLSQAVGKAASHKALLPQDSPRSKTTGL